MGGQKRGPIPILLTLLVAIVTLISAMFWPARESRPERTPALESMTFEEWLYDYYYSASRLGYDRDKWGGHVIYTDDPATIVNQSPCL